MKSSLLAVIAVLFFGGTASAQQPTPPPGAQQPAAQQPPAPATTNGTESAAEKYFTDIQLVNQNGEKMRFYHDLLQGKTVIINSFFATCQGSCLPMTRNLEKVQEALGD